MKGSQIRQQFALIMSLNCIAIAIAIPLLIVSPTMTSQSLSVAAIKEDGDEGDKNNNHNNNKDVDATLSVNTDKDSDSTSNALVEIIDRNPDCLPTTVKTILSSDHDNKDYDDDDDKNVRDAVDGDFETRWTAEKLGSYLQLDIGSFQKICSVDISWFEGDQKENNFVLSVSEDGSTFKDVLRTSSSGMTQTKEYYDFTPAEGKYLRITFYGNSDNEREVSVREVVVNTMRNTTDVNTITNLSNISELSTRPQVTNPDFSSYPRNDTASTDSGMRSAPIVSDMQTRVSSAASFEITLNATDSDPNDHITYHVVNLPAHGNLTAGTDQATVRYIPDEGFSGLDKFTYKAIDSYGLESNASTVLLDVNRMNINQPSHASSAREFPLLGEDVTEGSDRVDQIRVDRDPIRGQYIVVLKENSTAMSEAGMTSRSSENARLKAADEIRAMAEEARDRGAEVLNVYQYALNGYVIRTPENESATLVAELRKDPRVAFVEPDRRVYAFGQSIPVGVDRVDGDQSSALSGEGTGIPVDADIAILDTGIDLTHPDLNVYDEVSFVPGTSSADDDNGHGTHIAGIAAAKDNDIGVVGMAPGARLWAVKVLDGNGAGSISDIIAGIDYVTEHANEIDVVNLSFGCECNSPALDEAINNAVAAGITFVVAAGNSNKDTSSFSPANNPGVITVSAIVDSDGKCGGVGPSTKYGNDDSFASFSNHGSEVDIAAPGVGILSTYKDGEYALLSGTSMASPHVAGAAALYSSQHHGATPAEIRSAFTSSGSNPSTVCNGQGHGYFSGDPGSEQAPLLYAKNL
jgi:hypothetical protein